MTSSGNGVVTISVILFCQIGLRFFVVIDKFSEDYLKDLLREFDADPTRHCYSQVIQPVIGSLDEAENTWKLLPPIYIWSPMQQLAITMKCPDHSVELELGQWTDDLTNDGRSRNPRLVYGISGNTILIQRYLICRFHHQYLSAQEKILKLLPKFVGEALFPFDLHHRSAFDKAVVPFVKNALLSGASFQQISEQMANNNFESFARRFNYCYLKDQTLDSDSPSRRYPKFNDDILFSFPSSDKLIDLFLGDYNTHLAYYSNAVDTKKVKFCLSTDHTFKVGKHIGCLDEGGKFVNQFGKLFIILNENHEVVGWRLTRTTGHTEIKDLLAKVKSRIETTLAYIIIDDCCKEKNLYQTVFGMEVEVKLDLFHAVQRIVRELPDKNSVPSLKFSKEFGLVFRDQKDQEATRTMPTPSPDVIISNLEQFLNRYETFLSDLESAKREKLEKEITNLRKHIEKGCLSGILPGHGTEYNEMLHSLLNRSMLRGAPTIGAELAIAILSLIFAYYNNKQTGEKHSCNSKIVPLKPALCGHSDNSIDNHMTHVFVAACNENNDMEKHNEFSSEIKSFIEEKGQHLINVFQSTLSVLENVKASCSKKDFNAFDVPFLPSSVSFLNSSKHPSIDDQLHKSLYSFGLRTERIEKDGDCAFRCFLVQLRKVITTLEPGLQEMVLQQQRLVGLTQETEEEQMLFLRRVFVDSILKEEKYKQFIPEDDFLRAKDFYRSGVFASGVGDMVMNVLADIFSVPIFIISSSAEYPLIPLLPEKPLIDQPMYVALNSSHAGHYSATTQVTDDDTNNGEFYDCDQAEDKSSHKNQAICRCGKNKRGQPTCIRVSNSKCPCVKSKRPCLRECFCKICENRCDEKIDLLEQKQKEKSKGCSCGKTRQNKGGLGPRSCMDSDEMRSRCPCLKSRQKCCRLCCCKNCGNEFGSNKTAKISFKSKGKGNQIKKFKRSKGAKFLKESGLKIKQGTWTGSETVALTSILKMLSTGSVDLRPENVTQLYNWMIEQPTTQDGATETKIKGTSRCKNRVY